MREKGKRLLASLLVFVMVLTSLPGDGSQTVRAAALQDHAVFEQTGQEQTEEEQEKEQAETAEDTEEKEEQEEDTEGFLPEEIQVKNAVDLSNAAKAQANEEGILAHYSFSGLTDTVTGTAITDESGNGNDAVIRGTGASKRIGALVLPGGASGSDAAYVQLPTGMFDGQDTLTISVWLQNLTGSGDYAAMYFGTEAGSKGFPTSYWLLNPAKGGKFKSVITDGFSEEAPYNTETKVSETATTSNWQMYTTVITETEIIGYLDGKEVCRASKTKKVSEFGTGLLAYIGKSSYPDKLFQGAVKELKVYNKQLTDAEIASLYKEVIPDKKEESGKKATQIAPLTEKNIILTEGEEKTLPSETVVTLNDGTSRKVQISWQDSVTGETVTDTSKLSAGTYTLKAGKADYFANPFIEERADPYIVYDSEEGCYYFTSSWPAYGNKESGYDRIAIRKSATLEGLSKAEDHVIWRAHTEGEQKYHIWAPELHKINGKWYVYYAASTDSNGWGIRCFVLECAGNDVTDAASWAEKGKFTDKNGGTNGFDAMCLDMTYFENGGKSYVIWAYKGGDSVLKIAEVDQTSPWKLAGEPMELSVPEYSWERVNEKVNEGPAVLQKDGKIYVTFSASATGDEYCMGLLTADASSDLMDLDSWSKLSYPLLETTDLYEQYGPGHNSFTVDADGNIILVYHARDEECHQDQCAWAKSDPLYDPCRNATLAYLEVDSDGALVFTSTAHKQLADLDLSALELELTVNSRKLEDSLLASYPLIEDGTDTAGNSYHGTVTGPETKFENGLQINGESGAITKNYLDLSKNTELLAKIADSKKLTITAWVNNQTTDTNSNSRATVFAFGKDENNFYAFSTLNWARARTAFTVGGKELASNTAESIKYDSPGSEPSVLNAWYPIAVVLEDVSTSTAAATKLKYFMNGRLLCEATAPASIASLGELSFFYIGGGVNGNYKDFTGGIRNVSVYSTAFTEGNAKEAALSMAEKNLALELGATGGENALTVSQDIILPGTAYPDLKIAWTSDRPDVLDTNGALICPTDKEVVLNLTAKITSSVYEDFEKTVTFQVTVPVEVPKEIPLTLHYDMTTEGNKVVDVTGNGHDGELKNGQTGTAAVYGATNVLNFNGDDSTYVTIPDGTVNDLKDITVTMLVNNSGTKNATWAWALGKHSGKYFYMTPAASNSGKLRSGVGSNDTIGQGYNGEVAVVDSTGLKDSEWSLITATFSSTDKKLKLYKDGTLIGSGNLTCALSDLIDANKENGYLGKSFYDGDPYFTGSIADFRIYDGVFSYARVKSLYTEMLPALKDCSKENIKARMLGENQSLEEIKTDLALPESVNGQKITWSSSDEAVITKEGKVTRPEWDKQDETVVLTAAYLVNEEKAEAAYTVKVLREESPQVILGKDKAALEIPNLDDVRGNITLPTMGENGSVITWNSSKPYVISDQDDGNYKAGVVNRKAKDMTVTLTATLVYKNVSETKKFTATVKKEAPAKEFTKYLFAYFIGEDKADGEQIYFADSEDGLHWTALNEGVPVLTSDMGEKGLRDPFIIRSPEGDKFYLIATDLKINGNGNWGGAQTAGSQYIMVWESTDCVNWSDQRMCKVALDTAGCTWAPEAFYNDETGEYIVFWASKVSDDNYGVHQIYYCTTRDFYTFSEPEVWITLYNKDGDKISIIDTSVIAVTNKEGKKTYYRFSKNEADKKAAIEEGEPEGGKYTILETSDSLTGEWKRIHSDYLLDNSNRWVEGGTCFQFNGEEKWCLLLDNFGGGGYYPSITTDLSSGSFTKLDSSEYSFPANSKMRHGTVIGLTDEEYQAVNKKWGKLDSAPDDTSVEDAVIAQFNFDEEETGFTGGGAKAEAKGTVVLSEDSHSGKALSLDGSNSNWLNVTKENGESLLTGLNEVTFSYYSKRESSGQGWALYASSSTAGPVYGTERYFGIIDSTSTITAERYHNTSSRPASASGASKAGWKHVVVVVRKNSTSIYVDGVLVDSKNSDYLFSNIVGNNGIVQIGKANWGSGEYFKGLLDDFTIYNKALSQAEIDYISGKTAKVEEIRVSAEKNTIAVGEKAVFTAKVLPEVASDKKVTWSSEDESIATVNASGEVTGVAEGETTIKATAADGSGIVGSMKVAVKSSIPVEKIIINASFSAITVGSSMQLSAEAVPDNATDQKVTWTLEQEDTIVSITEDGLLKGEKPGTAVIWAETSNGVKESITVQVLDVLVESIVISADSNEVGVNSTLQLNAEVLPENAANKKLVWSVDKPETASVADGVVTGLKAGRAEIKATAADGSGVFYTYTVYVKEIPVQKIEISAASKKVKEGETLKLSAVVTPENASNKEITWSSRNEEIATVSADGTVTGVKAGTVVIKAAAKDGSGVTDGIEIMVEPILVESIQVNAESTAIKEGETTKVSATVLPENASNPKVIWSSESPATATVEQDGTVTGVKAGKAVIKATASDGSAVFGSVEITVNGVAVEKIEVSAATTVIKVGKSAKLTANVLPENASNKEVKWSSGDETVATVTQDGTVTGVKTGKAVITAAAQDGSGISGKLEISVEESNPDEVLVEKIEISASGNEIEEGKTLALNAKVSPETATNQTLVWSSENPETATVGKDGLVTGVKAGNTVVKASATDGSGVFGEFAITVIKKGETPNTVTDIRLSSDTEGVKIENEAAVLSYQSEGDNKGLFNRGDSIEVKASAYHLDSLDSKTEISFSSSNSSVAEILSQNSDSGNHRAQIKLNGAGTAKITVKAKDAAEFTKELTLIVQDYTPQLVRNTITVSKYMTEGVSVGVQAQSGTAILDSALYRNKTDAGKAEGYVLTKAAESDHYLLTAEGLKKGVEKLFVKATVTEKGQTYTFFRSITVTVTEAKAAAVIKQNKKVNVFYNGDAEEGTGNLTITGKNAEIKKVTFEPVITEGKGYFEVENYEGVAQNTLSLKIKQKNITNENYNVKNGFEKKGTLSVYYEGYAQPYQKVITIATENKAPGIKTETAQNSFYPNVIDSISFRLYDSKAKQYLDMPEGTKAGWQNEAKDYASKLEAPVIEEGRIKLVRKESFTKGGTTAKILLTNERIWRNQVVISHKVSIKPEPQMKLVSTKLTLNNTEGIWGKETASTGIYTFNNVDLPVKGVSISGKNAKSKTILGSEEAVKLGTAPTDGIIQFAFTGSTIEAKLSQAAAPGSYDFILKPQAVEGDDLKTLSLKVTVVKNAPSLTVSAKGSINLIDRENTAISYTTNLKNLNGVVTEAVLSGQDAEYFECEVVGTGKNNIALTAKKGASLTAGKAYKMKLMVTLDNTLQVTTAKEFSVKPKQVNPKIVLNTTKIVLNDGVYGAESGRRLDFEIISPKDAAYDSIILTNYSDDFTYDYNVYTGEGILMLNENNGLKAGKTYSLKFALSFEGAADSAKPVYKTVKVQVAVKK